MEGSSTGEVNPLGPVQEYVAPEYVLELRFKVVPAQTGLLLVSVGDNGPGLTVTETVLTVLVHPFTVIVNEYVPVAAVLAFIIVGSSNSEVNPFGPVQLYIAPTTVLLVKFKVLPAQIGLLLLTVGAAGDGVTVTVT